MTRKEMEAQIISKRIICVRWAEFDDFGHPASLECIDGFELEDGTFLAVSGSGQIDIASVWLNIEKETK